MLSKDMRRHKGQPARGYYTYEECITYWRLHREKYPADLTPEEKIPKRQKIEEERERQRRLSKEKTRKDPNTVYPYDTWEQYFKTVEDRERKAKEEEMEARARDAQMDAVRALVAELPSRLPVGKKGKGIANDNQGPNCKSAAWSLMEAQGKRGMPAPPTMTPKAVIHQKYGAKACYSVEEAREAVDGGCPGLALPQQTRSVYRCKLEIPGLAVVTPGTFVRKKDAEQAAAQIALDKLGIQATANAPSTPKEAWDELIARISGFFADENFPSSSHPLIGHMCVTFRRTGDRFGMIPLSAIAACDVKVNTLCKLVDPKAEFDPLLVLSLIYNAAKKSPGVSVSDSNLWVRNQKPYSPEAVDVALQRWTSIMNPIEVDGIFVPCVMEDEPKTMTLTLSHNEHYMGDIVSNLSASDSSLAVVSRTVGKASSEIRLYFSAPNVQFVSEMSNNGVASLGDSNMECVINRRASYISGQTIYGDAILANVGYTGRDSELHTEDVTLSTYYRILLGKLPDGNYKMSRDSILVAELPSGYSRSSWKGLSPRYLLCSFCRLQRLAEPYFNVSTASASCKVLGSAVSSEGMEVLKNAENQYGGDGSNGKENPDMFKCEVKIYSKMQKLLLEYSTANIWSKESDAIHNSSLKVLIWFHSYFKQLNMHGQKFSLSKSTDGFRIYADNFLDEFAMFLSIYGNTGGDESSACSTAGSLSMDISEQKLENNAILTHIEGPDSGIYPSHGSLTCISYTASLVVKDKAKRYLLESNNEFEFEIGTRAVRNQLESCVSQLSVNQSACFIAELPPRDLILAAASEFSHDLSNISRDNCLLEFSVKVTEPLEDRMEKALFNPPLSKQRVEFAVDFGCGSGSLLDSLLEHPTTLEKIVGVDISRKGLTRAAKSLHQKLSKKSLMHTTVPTAVLYDGSITDFDSRLYRFDIGTCLEVIEHVEEEQASLFGDVVLSSFCPTVLIVSTPNYEYNPILQRSAMPNKEDEPEENTGPCKFRNHDHKFEWTRAQFQHWATGLAEKHNYSVEFSGVGGSGEEPGFASQIAVFRRMAPSQEEVCQDGELHQPYEEGELEVALGVFRNMVEQGVRPNQAAVVTALSAAARLGLLEHGKFVHDVVRRAGMSVSMNVGTALVDMYAKCGCVDVAREVFDGMKRRDVFSWNAMICGLAAHGLGRDAVELFERFISEGLCPTNVTFVGVLNGCSRSGLVTEGRRYFKLMVEEYHIEPEMEHYGCMVDLLGRAGLVPEAIELIEGMHIAPDPVLWGTVLSSCKTHGLVDLGVSVGNKLIELDPTHDGYYVLLSSIYAKANKWDEVRKVRKLMSSRGTSKSAAWSLMEAQGKVHKFLVGDTYHKDSVQIYDTLDMINKRLTEAGYVPDVSSVLHDIGDEEKVGAIKVHSERLAIAYGFIVLKSGSPIRIVKNLRVCGDCHEFIKMVTMVFKMEIISLHQKLSKKSLMHISIPTAVLYDGQ
uniref:Small RNA 2'-O-methyltransferase n=1 Tax=Leersia perrieri TaxID=77586 RepID=A0A0D9WVU7_9ORYZ